MEIIREASDKHKGIILQKLRAIKLAFDTLLANPVVQIHIAIEYNGDVFIYSDTRKFLEENKNYDSKNFSFLSHQVLNTLIYFLDYWLRETVEKSSSLVFSFYSTNDISKEYNVEKIRDLSIILPDKPILELLSSKDFDYSNLLDSCKQIILDEYSRQYKGKKHNYSKLELFTNDDWKNFFKLIQWNFGMPANEELKKEIILSINKYAAQKRIDVTGKEEIIKAYLSMRLEDNQYADDQTQRFLTDETIELIFHRVANQQIAKDVYKFIDYDYTELRYKAAAFATEFLTAKYFAVNPKGRIPDFLKRKVKYHSSEVRIHKHHLEESKLEIVKRMDVVVGDISSFISGIKPTFLFGEIGSGKSSLITQYAIEENNNNNLNILIPVSYIKGQLTIDHSSIFTAIDSFINSNLKSGSSTFNFDFLLLNQAKATIIFDGLDELSAQEAKFLIKHLEKLNEEQANITVIATGRPLELQSIINFNDWNCLTTVDLFEEEILEILKNEAIAAGLSQAEAITDAKHRIDYLNSRKELSNLAKTPLVVCMVREYLTEGVEEQSLGSLMYKVLNKRLEWDETDLKTNYANFFTEYSNAYQREGIISSIAFEIANSDKKIITDARLYEIVNESIPDNTSKKRIVTEAISFYKNVFLQQSDNSYSFASQPLFEIAYSIGLSEQIRESEFELEILDNNWRPLSFAVGINRLKGHIEPSKPFLVKAITKLLYHEGNTPHAAAIVSESKDSMLAQLYIDEISKLEFRPLRTWGDEGLFNSPDSYSPYAIADVINLAGAPGFTWFFNEYLDPIHPTHTGEETQIQYILKNYFVIKSFTLRDEEKEKLSSIIPLHIAARTSGCTFILPFLVLAIPEMFSPQQRCILLADVLHHRMLQNRCKELLQKEITEGKKDIVLNALEIICSKNDRKENTANLLWLTHSDVDINNTIFHTAIIAASGGDDLLYQAICDKIGETNLNSYLKYCTLNNTQVAAFAALLLYTKFNERDFYIIARPLLTQTEWFDYKDERRKKILDEVLLTNKELALKYMLGYIPSKRNKEEVPELYLNYFIQLLSFSDNIFKNEFLYVVSRLPEYPVLSRYSEIREGFKNLIIKKPQYRDFLKQAQENLDFRLRFNANCILLACFPESSKSELENTIRSANKRLSDHHEWIRFCMKLNYSTEVLRYIFSILDVLPGMSKQYALCILYHQNYPLSSKQTQELVEGLLGESYFLDTDSYLVGGDGLKRIVEQPEFYETFIKHLGHDNVELAEKSASILLSFHSSKLTKRELAKVYILECEKWDRYIYDFDRHKISLFDDEEFIKSFQENCERLKRLNNGKEPLMSLYYKVINGDKNSWLQFFQKIIYSGLFVDSHDLDFLYRWLKYLQKKKPTGASFAGDAANELMTYPVVSEKKDFNSILPQLSIIASEFKGLQSEEMGKILLNYECHDEIACSLISRIDKIPTGYRPSRMGESYTTLFSKNNSSVTKKYSVEEIEKVLIDGDEIPESLPEYMRSVLLYGIYTSEELSEKANIGKLASFFYSIIQFCRNGSVDFSIILTASDKIGWPFYRQAAHHSLKEALYIIKEIQINSKESFEKYVGEVISKIENTRDDLRSDLIDHFKELFSFDVSLDVKLLSRLFNELMNHPFYLDTSLMYQILDFIANKVKEEDFPILSSECENYLKAFFNQHSKRGLDEGNISLMWMFSIIAFYVDRSAKDYSIMGFLKGLESVFIINSRREYLNEAGSKIKFKGRDLLIHSEPVYKKIEPAIFKEAILEGANCGTAEIMAICKILQGLSGSS